MSLDLFVEVSFRSRARSVARVLPRVLSIVGISMFARVGLAQSFNVDMNSPGDPPALGGGVPSNAFGAVPNQPGFWTSFPVTTSAVPMLNLTTGAATSSTVQITATSTVMSMLAFNNSSNTGDFALLLNDGSQTGTILQGGTRTYTFSGLVNGPYSLVTYTAPPPIGSNGHLIVDVPGSTQGPLIATGIPTGNTFIPGVTHVVHTLNITTGGFTVLTTDIPGDPGGFVDGFQITLVPEPGSAASAGALLFFATRRPTKRRAR